VTNIRYHIFKNISVIRDASDSKITEYRISGDKFFSDIRYPVGYPVRQLFEKGFREKRKNNGNNFPSELKRKKEKLNYIKMQLKRMKFCINDTNCQYEISTGY